MKDSGEGLRWHGVKAMAACGGGLSRGDLSLITCLPDNLLRGGYWR